MWGRDVVAGVIQLVECQLPKLDVAGSSPVARSNSGRDHVRESVVGSCFVRDSMGKGTRGWWKGMQA